MDFAQSPEPIAALNLGAHSWIPSVQSQSRDRVKEALEEVVDEYVVNLVQKIPYYSWGGAINGNRIMLEDALLTANYETVMAVCHRLLSEPEIYKTNDLRDRPCDLVIRAIEKRLKKLGYVVTKTKQKSYLNSGTGNIMQIPVVAEKRMED